MLALGSNQLLVLMLSGLLLASGAALVVAESPSDGNNDDLGDQTGENQNTDPGYDEMKCRDPNLVPGSDRYAAGDGEKKDQNCDKPERSDEGAWEGAWEGDWDCDMEAWLDRFNNGVYDEDGASDERPGERPGQNSNDRPATDPDQRQRYCQMLRERLGENGQDPNVRPDGTDHPDQDGRPQREPGLWVTTAVVDGGVLIVAGGPNGPLPGVALWVDNLPSPFITNDQGWLWLEKMREGCHVVKALYQPGDHWLWAQTEFCLKERPEPPQPPRELLKVKIELLDRDADGFTELVLVHVYGLDGAPVEGAKVVVDGERAGETGPKGLADFRIQRGGVHLVEVGYRDQWVKREFLVEPRDDDPDPEPRYGVIEGVVLGVSENEEWRLPGALVQLRPADNWREEFARTETGERGAFRFGEVPAGKWELRVSHEGYNVAEVVVEIFGGKVIEVTIELKQQEPDPEPRHMWIEVEQTSTGVLAIVSLGDDRLPGAGVKLDGTYIGKTDDHGMISLGQPEAGEHQIFAHWTSPNGESYEAVAEFYIEDEPDPEPVWIFTANLVQNYYVQFFVKTEEGQAVKEAPIYLGNEVLGYTNDYGTFYIHITDWEPGTYTAVTVDPAGNEYAATFVIEDPDPPAPVLSFTAEVFAGGQDGVANDVRLRVTLDDYGVNDVAVNMGDGIAGYTNVYGYFFIYDMEEGRYGAWVNVEDTTAETHWVIG